MTPSAIAKLRRKFIALAMASFFVVIAFLGIASFAISVNTTVNEANRMIDAILDADGSTPGRANFGDGPFHEEASFGLRFFTVTFDEDGNELNVDLSHVASVGETQALEVAAVAADPSTFSGLGVSGNYFYKEGSVDGGSMVVFLDRAVQLANMRAIGMNTLLACLGALLITFALVVVLSKRAIQPEVENARRQQQFVTNAGHELKTPIAVIRANTELSEMMSGETEWTQSTLRQVDRLDGLVRDLMTIARGQERAEAEGEGAAEVDVTRVVREAADSFSGIALQKGLGLEREIEGGVTLRGNAASIEQLTCLLVDNALKYCDECGAVRVRLAPGLLGRGCTLAVSNDYAAGADVDYQRFFDRFYREDEAHENQQGYGIGLSVAESICKRYHGSIKASWKAGTITFTCTLRNR